MKVPQRSLEYGLIAALVSVAIIGGLNSVSGEIVSMWEYLGDTID